MTKTPKWVQASLILHTTSKAKSKMLTKIALEHCINAVKQNKAIKNSKVYSAKKKYKVSNFKKTTYQILTTKLKLQN